LACAFCQLISMALVLEHLYFYLYDWCILHCLFPNSGLMQEDPCQMNAPFFDHSLLYYLWERFVWQIVDDDNNSTLAVLGQQSCSGTRYQGYQVWYVQYSTGALVLYSTTSTVPGYRGDTYCWGHICSLLLFIVLYYLLLMPSEAEEWLILVQRGYYNNPVPAYFSTSHLLILIQTRISISWLWTILSQLWTIVSRVVYYYNPVVDYCKQVVDYCKLVGLF